MKYIKVLLLIIICLSLVGCKNDIEETELFLLEEKYYGNSGITEISVDEFNNLVDTEESFGLFIYQDFCAASASFEEVLLDYVDEYDISFYKLSYNDMKETKLKSKIKFYPSFVIYNEGNFVDFLDADSDEDADYYKSVSGFNDWFSQYVVMN